MSQDCCSSACRVREFQREKRGSKPRDEVRSYTCTHCGTGYESASALPTLYCSNKCKVAAWAKANPDRHAESRKRAATNKVREAQPSYSKVFFNTCRVCGKHWTGKTSSAVCGYKCHTVEVFRSAAKEVSCIDCGAVFCPTYEASRGRPSIRCHVCQDAETQAHKRIAKAARKAREIAATVEDVDPYKVFTRDKWHCQECGVSTPRSLRGTYEDDAPELDHIKPLSKGGDHSYKNTQCLCRRCNLEKSDTWQPQEVESLLQA